MAQALITLTPHEEMARHGGEDLPDARRSQGLVWLKMPVQDDAIAASILDERWQAQKARAHVILDHGGTLAVRCNGSSGSTGLMAAMILLERGNQFEQVLSMVQELRPRTLKLQAHLDYLTGISKVTDKGNRI